MNAIRGSSLVMKYIQQIKTNSHTIIKISFYYWLRIAKY